MTLQNRTRLRSGVMAFGHCVPGRVPKARAGFDLLDKRLEIGGFGAPAMS
jgi:hypothetical protein